jgi:arsenate reductase
MSDFPITIFHNPRCGTSRGALELIRAAGHEPTIVEYLKDGWTRPQLLDLLDRTGLSPRALLREKEPLAAELGLADASDETILAGMIEHPILVNRPIVITSKGAVLARPSEKVAEVL